MVFGLKHIATTRASRPAVLAAASLWFALQATAAPVFAQSQAQAKPSVGTVALASGQVWRVQGDQRQPLERGAEVFPGDQLESGDGQLILKLQDGGIVSLRANSRLTLQEYSNNGIRLKLEEGVVRSVTGSVGGADKSKFRINSPFSALGIRGTDFITQVQGGQQYVYVVQGEVVLSPFTADCSAAALGPCAGPQALALAASASQALSLNQLSGQVVLTSDFPQSILPAGFEAADFAPAASISPQWESAPRTREFADGAAYDRNGNRIKPVASIEDNVRYDPDRQAGNLPPATPVADSDQDPGLPGGPDQTPNQLAQLAELLLFEGVTGDADGDGVLDFAELLRATNPWRADQPANAAPVYWFDGQAAPLDQTTTRTLLSDFGSVLNVFDFGGFGQASFYSARLAGGRSASMWVSSSNQVLWGERRVLGSLLSTRFLPEGANGLWARLAGSNAFANPAWVQQVARNQADLWEMPLHAQALAFTPRAPSPQPLAAAFQLDFTQQLRQPESGMALAQAAAPQFSNIRAFGDSFSAQVNLGGSVQTISGTVQPNGLLFARHGGFEVRGTRQGNALLLMVSEVNAQGQPGQQWVLGYSQTNLPLLARPVAPVASNGVAAGGVTWGRWSNYAQLDANSVATVLGLPAGGAANTLVGNNRHFAFSAPAQPNLPNQGRFAFNLADSQAVYSGASGLRPADVSNATLNVDFNRSQFSTYMDVTAPGAGTHAVFGGGAIGQLGQLAGDPRASNAELQGAITQGGRGAVLLFERALAPGESLSGITHWGR